MKEKDRNKETQIFKENKSNNKNSNKRSNSSRKKNTE
jgi:hypothetical protein